MGRLTEKIYGNLSSNKNTISSFRELQKACDTVYHNILLDKIEQLGRRGIVLDFIRNYLENRNQTVNIEKFTKNNNNRRPTKHCFRADIVPHLYERFV